MNTETRMKALSIKQPWAWLILHGGKDIENRTWRTNFRGRVLIHVGKTFTRPEYEFAAEFAATTYGIHVPPMNELQTGGIVGSVEIVDCVDRHDSPWFGGPYGLVLKDPKRLDFTPMMGQLRFFDVDPKILKTRP